MRQPSKRDPIDESGASAGDLPGVAEQSLCDRVRALSPRALELLRVLTLAEPPVERGRLETVWFSEPRRSALLWCFLERTKEEIAMAGALESLFDERPKEDWAAVLAEVPPDIRDWLTTRCTEPEPNRAFDPLLAELVAHGLVVPDDAAGPVPTCSLRWHELVREEAARALPAEVAFDEPSWFRRHAAWATAQLRGSDGDLARVLAAGWLAHSFFPHLNIDGLMTSVALLGPRARTQAELGAVDALARAVLDLESEGRARAALRRWRVASLQQSGEWDELVRLHVEALESAKASGALQDASQSASDLGAAHLERGDWDAAARAFDEELELNLRWGAGRFDMLHSRTTRLRAEVSAGFGTRARPALDALVIELKALVVESRRDGSKDEPDVALGYGQALNSALQIRMVLARQERDAGTMIEAIGQTIEFLERAATQPEALAQEHLKRARMLMEVGQLDAAQRDVVRAAALFTGARRDLWRELGRADCLSWLAGIAEQRGDLARAIQLEEESLGVRYGGELGPAATAHNDLSDRLRKVGRHAEAVHHATVALLLYRLFHDHPWMHGHTLRKALAAAGPAAEPARVADLDRAFPRLAPLLEARGLSRTILDPILAAALAAPANPKSRRADLMTQRRLLELAGRPPTVAFAGTRVFQGLLAALDLPTELPAAAAIAAAFAKITAELSTLDAEASSSLGARLAPG